MNATQTSSETSTITTLHTDRAAAVLAAALAAVAGTADHDAAVATIISAAGTESAAEVVRGAQGRLLTSLARNPFFDPEGVRASRLLFAAGDALRAAPVAALASAA